MGGSRGREDRQDIPTTTMVVVSQVPPPPPPAPPQEPQPKPHQHHVVIIGAGMAGLTCARELLSPSPSPSSSLSSMTVSVVEAASAPGGRVWSRRNAEGAAPWHGHDRRGGGGDWDLGAEFVHGTGTVLTDLVDELFPRSGIDNGHGLASDEDVRYEPVFITSHADGGPDEAPTPSGKYGMYYVDGQLRMYNDPLIQPLSAILQSILHPDDHRDQPVSSSLAAASTASTAVQVGMVEEEETPAVVVEGASLGAALANSNDWWSLLSPSLRALAVASYANTAGCADLHQLSLPVLRHFEAHWARHETAGDYRLSAVGIGGGGGGGGGGGFTTVVEALVCALQKDDRFRLQCHWHAHRIQPQQQQQQPRRRHVETNHGHRTHRGSAASIAIESVKGDILHADAVVLTIPPQLWHDLDVPLSSGKREAMGYVGFERIVKVVCAFETRFWPAHLQSVICATDDDAGHPTPIPELWFTDRSDGSYLAVGYLASQFATDFIKAVKHESATTHHHHDDDYKEDETVTTTTTTTRATAREQAAANIVIRQLAQVLSTSAVALTESLIDCFVYDWQDDHPTVQGGYMYPVVGMTVQHLHDLAAPDERMLLFYAGEATNTNACCTVQAAMETGLRAAREVRAALAESSWGAATTTTTPDDDDS